MNTTIKKIIINVLLFIGIIILLSGESFGTELTAVSQLANVTVGDTISIGGNEFANTNMYCIRRGSSFSGGGKYKVYTKFSFNKTGVTINGYTYTKESNQSLWRYFQAIGYISHNGQEAERKGDWTALNGAVDDNMQRVMWAFTAFNTNENIRNLTGIRSYGFYPYYNINMYNTAKGISDGTIELKNSYIGEGAIIRRVENSTKQDLLYIETKLETDSKPIAITFKKVDGENMGTYLNADFLLQALSGIDSINGISSSSDKNLQIVAQKDGTTIEIQPTENSGSLSFELTEKVAPIGYSLINGTHIVTIGYNNGEVTSITINNLDGEYYNTKIIYKSINGVNKDIGVITIKNYMNLQFWHRIRKIDSSTNKSIPGAVFLAKIVVYNEDKVLVNDSNSITLSRYDGYTDIIISKELSKSIFEKYNSSDYNIALIVTEEVAPYGYDKIPSTVEFNGEIYSNSILIPMKISSSWVGNNQTYNIVTEETSSLITKIENSRPPVTFSMIKLDGETKVPIRGGCNFDICLERLETNGNEVTIKDSSENDIDGNYITDDNGKINIKIPYSEIKNDGSTMRLTFKETSTINGYILPVISNGGIIQIQMVYNEQTNTIEPQGKWKSIGDTPFYETFADGYESDLSYALVVYNYKRTLTALPTIKIRKTDLSGTQIKNILIGVKPDHNLCENIESIDGITNISEIEGYGNLNGERGYYKGFLTNGTEHTLTIHPKNPAVGEVVFFIGELNAPDEYNKITNTFYVKVKYNTTTGETTDIQIKKYSSTNQSSYDYGNKYEYDNGSKLFSNGDALTLVNVPTELHFQILKKNGVNKEDLLEGAGFEFYITSDIDPNSKLWESPAKNITGYYITDSKGKISIDITDSSIIKKICEAGNIRIYFKETTKPTGFNSAYTSAWNWFGCKINGDKIVSKSSNSTNDYETELNSNIYTIYNYKTLKFKFSKLDGSDKITPLPGAGFKFYITSYDDENTKLWASSSEYFTSNEENKGEIEINIKKVKLLQNLYATNGGLLKLHFKETTVPDGYTSPYTGKYWWITCKIKGNKIVAVGSNEDNNYKTVADSNKYIIYNYPGLTFEFLKQDGENKVPLQGATFDFYITGSFNGKNGRLWPLEEAKTDTTNAEGKIIVNITDFEVVNKIKNATNLKIFFRETVLPEGYSKGIGSKFFMDHDCKVLGNKIVSTSTTDALSARLCCIQAS